jgi:uncharacterized protein YgbK (DUF1537 family)
MILALADDFSGAAEVAGVAFRHGLNTRVATGPERPSNVEFLAIDMATRSLPSTMAREKALDWGKFVAEAKPSLFYKKTDSVLRGHIAVELFAMLVSMGRRLGLLVPANPARGRIISNGEYRIDNVPLGDTEFARDPSFPIQSSQVTNLVSGAESLAIDGSLSGTGLVIGDAETEQDLDRWAEKMPPHTIPAGASPFLAALMRKQGLSASAQATPSHLIGQTMLLVCGSQSDNARKLIASLKEKGAPIFDTTSAPEDVSAQEIAKALEKYPITVLRHSPETSHSSQELTAKIASITMETLRLHPTPHLCLEGGETAAAVLTKLNEKSFGVHHEWEPGVVSLVSDSQLTTTVKPGSYRWPPQLLGQVDD